jgi:hypothetical protein
MSSSYKKSTYGLAIVMLRSHIQNTEITIKHRPTTAQTSMMDSISYSVDWTLKIHNQPTVITRLAVKATADIPTIDIITFISSAPLLAIGASTD